MKSLSPAPVPAHLLTAPLCQLLVALDAVLVESGITDDRFFGAAVVRRDGRIILSMPSGRSDAERDTIARSLLGNALGVDLSPLPSSLEARELAAV